MPVPEQLDLSAIKRYCEATTEGIWTYDPKTQQVDVAQGTVATGVDWKPNGEFIQRAHIDLPRCRAVIEALATALELFRGRNGHFLHRQLEGLSCPIRCEDAIAALALVKGGEER